MIISSTPSITSSSTNRGFDNISIDQLLTHLTFSLRTDIGVNRRDVIEVSTDIVDEIMEREGGLLNLTSGNWLSFSSALLQMQSDLANKNVEKLLSYINKFPPLFSLREEAPLAEEIVTAYQAACTVILDQIMGKKLPDLSSEDVSSLSLALIETQAKLADKKVTQLLNYANKFLPFSVSQGEAKRTEESVAVCRKAFAAIFNEIVKHKEKLSRLSVKDLLSLSSVMTKAYINGVLTEDQFVEILPDIFDSSTGEENKNQFALLSPKEILIFSDALIESKEAYIESSNFLALFNTEATTITQIVSLLRKIKNQFTLKLEYLSICSMIAGIVFRNRMELLPKEKESTDLLLTGILQDLRTTIYEDFKTINSSLLETQPILDKINLSLGKLLNIPSESLEEIEKNHPEQAAGLVELKEQTQKALKPADAQLEVLASSLKEVVQILVSHIAKPGQTVTEKEKQYLRILFRIAETIGFSQEVQTKMGWSSKDVIKKGWFYVRPGDTNTAKADMTKATLTA